MQTGVEMVPMRWRAAVRQVVTAGVVLVGMLMAAIPGTARDARLARNVDAYLQPLVDVGVFQGTVLVAGGEDVLVDKGYGFANVELGVRNTPARLFRIASLSKVFTDVALGKLAEAGRLGLDDPLARFLPEHPLADKMTLRSLMMHRAGVPNINSIPYDEEAWQPNTLDSLVRVLAGQPLDFEPGSRRRYSNGGYALLACVIQRVAGTTYGDFLQREVCAPLGLAHTVHEDDGMLVPDRAYGYMPSPTERHRLVPAPFQQMATKTGGGSLVSSAGDLHRFLRAFYGDNVIKAETWRELFSLADSTVVFQGRCPGFNAYMMRDFAHDLVVIVLSNNYANGTIATVAQDLAALARGGKPQPPAWRADLPADSTRSRGLVGLYRAPAGALPFGDWPFDIRWRDGDLLLFRGQRALDVLLPQADGAFLLRNMVSELRFQFSPGAPAVQANIRPLWLDRTVAMERMAGATRSD